MIKLDSAGNHQWSGLYQDETAQYGAEAYTVAQTADDGYVLGGIRLNNITKGIEDTKVLTHGPWLAKVNSTGALSWFRNYVNISAQRYPNVLKITPQGDILAGGSINTGDMALTKFDSTGTWQWDFSLDDLPAATAKGLELTNDGGCVMVGSGISNGAVVVKINNVY